MARVTVRREVLEFGSVPVALLLPELDANFSLPELHARFHSLSTVNSKGIRVIAAHDVAKCLSFTDDNLRALATCIQAASPHASCFFDEHQHLASFAMYDLSMYLFAELYGREVARPEATDHWPEAAQAAGAPSPAEPGRASSPGKDSGGRSNSLLRHQLQQHVKHHEQQVRGFTDYIKRNLKNLLQLVLDTPDPATPATSMTPLEVNRLAFLLQPHPDPHPDTPAAAAAPHQPPLLSSVLACFAPPAAPPVPPLTVVLQYLASALNAAPDAAPRLVAAANGAAGIKIQREVGLVGSAGYVDGASIVGLYKGTVVRGEGDFPAGEAAVADCHDAVVYALAPLKRVLVLGCSECTVVLGAISVSVRVEKCERVMLVAATASIVVSSCHDCTFHLGTATAPLLVGDNRFIKLAPHNVRYERLGSHIRKAGLRTSTANLWNAPILLAARDRRSTHCPDSPRWFSTPESPHGAAPSPKSTVAYLPPDDFLPYTVPFKGSTGFLAGGPSNYSSVKWSHVAAKHPSSTNSSFPFPLPPEYEAALAAKHAYVTQLRANIKGAVLEDARRRELQAGIQAFFRDWLGATNNIRQVYDLSKLEGDDTLPAPGAGVGGAAAGGTGSAGGGSAAAAAAAAGQAQQGAAPSTAQAAPAAATAQAQ